MRITLLILACFTLLFAADQPMTDPLLHAKDRVLFEGDSLTDGLRNNYGRMEAWDRTWAHRADEWLFAHRPDLDLESRNLAVGGSSAKTLLNRVELAVAYKPSVILLTIGTNDAIMKVPVETFSEQFTAWCDRLRAAGCRRIIHVGGFPPCPNVDDETRGILARCAPYWAAAKQVVETRGGLAIDVAPYLLPRVTALDRRWKHHTVYSSGVHYNALGNELIAGAVLTSLGLMAVPDVH